jgi:hypothetical protein
MFHWIASSFLLAMKKQKAANNVPKFPTPPLKGAGGCKKGE